MALNISPNSVPSTHLLETSLSSAIKFGNGYVLEGSIDKNSTGFGNYRAFNWELENFQDCEREKTELLSDDITDLLPSDPFGMDLSTTFTAITGWLEDIENDLGLTSLGFITDKVEVEAGEDGLFAGLNLVWNGAVKFHQDVNNSKIQESSIESDKELWAGLCDDGLHLDGNIEDFMGFSYDKYWVSSNADNEFQMCTKIHSDGDEGAPHDALFFALGYLGLRDLLSVERVCKSFRDAVQNDPLLWRSIHIDQPLSEKITDYALLQLTSRAQGTLQCLSLVECFRITDSGLTHVLESNPGLTKLCVPGCVRLSVEGILCNFKAFKSAGKLSVKLLRIGGLCGITNKQFEELKFLLGADRLPGARKPRFYRDGQLYLSCDDDRAIDIEACPRCDKPRQVYDCPAESCQGELQSPQLCRACTLCIARCFHCGCCINGCDYEETFFLDLLCLDCWKQLLSCQNEQDEMGRSSKCTAFHQQASYHFYLCG
ncbi:F-box protein SKIP14-like [Actinidia eriantha]|uniref:F-box protein SKIP14-like n=1 Tax=Actinidia eriantha TaxID=165200 RepID=UPI00258ADDD2|nr:F-box protein SKIP14-like [Actinidia eriantha]